MEDLDEVEEWEYELSGFYKIFYSLMAAGIILFGINLSTTPSAAGPLFSVIMISIIMLIAALIILNVIRRKLVIDKDRIVCTSLFLTRELPIHAIRGRRVSSKAIIIESSSPEYPRIYIGNYTDLANSSDIRNWVTTNFKDLNAEDLATARQQMLEDPTLGNSPEEREQKFKRARAVAIGYNAVSVLTGFTMIFFSSAFNNISVLLLPWVGVLVLLSNKGLIKLFGASDRTINPQIILGMVFPSFFLVLKALNSYNLLLEEHLWLPAFLLAFILIVPLYFKGINPAAGALKGQWIFIALTGLLYGFGSIILVNCAFDEKPAELYQAEVLRHWYTTGRGSGHYIKLSPWGPQSEPTTVEITRQFYHNTFIGDSVLVRLKPGLLQIPWYQVEKREDNIITERKGINPN